MTIDHRITFKCMTMLGLLALLPGLAMALVCYNDCVYTSGDPNVTQYNGAIGGGSGVASGLLMDYDTGLDTGISVTMECANVAASIASMPDVGTEANDIFGFLPNFGPSSSYNSSSLDWYYQVTFSGLDPSKAYTFVTSANRNSSSYVGEGAASRWTKFSIIGADSYLNDSTPGVVEISADVVRMNTGYNTEAGCVVRWVNITAADGEFTVISQNVGVDGPGEPNKSYGMQAFMLEETVPQATETTTLSDIKRLFR